MEEEHLGSWTNNPSQSPPVGHPRASDMTHTQLSSVSLKLCTWALPEDELFLKSSEKKHTATPF